MRIIENYLQAENWDSVELSIYPTTVFFHSNRYLGVWFSAG